MGPLQLSRDHGGASAPHSSARNDLDERSVQRIKERQRIGKIAASLVADGDVIMIDAGSTTIEFARFLAYAGTRVVVITNSLQVAMALAGPIPNPCPDMPVPMVRPGKPGARSTTGTRSGIVSIIPAQTALSC